MVKKTWVLSLILFLVFFQLLSTQAQIIQKKYNINWQDNLVYRPNEHVTIELLYFTGAISDENYPVLPLFYDQFNVDNFFSDYQVTIMGMETKEMDAGDVRLIPGTFEQPSVDVRVKTVIDRKENLAAVTFIPIIKDAGGKFLQITSITLGITPDRSSIVRRDAKSDRTYAANSVLSTGSWYKISTTQTGLHKVAFEDLQALGISATSIPSSQITLFGNGGTILPEANSEFTYDDLQENPIWMHDGGDGTFDSGDYFVFYATAPHVWTYNSNSGRFVHTLNPYCDNVYYFINVDAGVGIGKRVQGEDNSALVADGTATTYTHYTYFEEDKIALVESGRSWLGDLFDVVVEKEYSFTVPPVANKPGSVGVSVGFVNTRARMQVAVNGTNVGAVSYDTSYPKNAANLRTNYLAFTPNSTDLTVKLTYSKPDNSSSAYLDWIELQMICNLSMHSAQFPFTVPETWKENQVTEFVIANANSNTKVWDVTEPVNPVRMIGSLDNGAFIFKTTTDKLRKFVAFNGTSYLPVTVVGKVDNQNLHGDLTVENDMIIVTHPNFLAQANKLAKFRRENDNLKVKVVTIGQVYNEFSSGATDPTAIRNYMRMIYDKTDGAYPKYLLLVGRPSFDYRNRAENSVCYVPNYQVDSKLINNSERANDDYFGLLDWNEGRDCSGQIDLAVGRFPVTSVAQANTAVDKAINYSEKRDLTLGANGTQVSNLADWRNVVTFIADDEDNNAHLKSADSSAELLAEANKIVNIEKIYCDAYQQVSHSGGQRYPDVNTAINNRMERGAF
ncbi:type IX secretion system sortase PorU, partial [Bacteroidales bacterium OttesenSCG-928-B11]|nr:type IX secretion system sortase PorU [Bacteroidales bacterium OttesenSCG-928-B11]